MAKAIPRALLAVLLAILLCFIQACETTGSGQRRYSNHPVNRPADWENPDSSIGGAL